MRIIHLIESKFWVFLLLALVLGLVMPFYNDFLLSLLVPELVLLFFIIFLKVDIQEIIESIKDIRFIGYLVILNLVVIPTILFFSIKIFSPLLALQVLLLTSMPAGASTPALVDLLKGNTSLALSLVIFTTLCCPFTVPFLLGVLTMNELSIDYMNMFGHLVGVIFVPMIIAQIIKKYFNSSVEKAKPFFISINVMVLSLMVYATFGSQRERVLSDPINVLWNILALYLVFTILHIVGFLIVKNRKIEDKISVVVSNAYMNNGMAIVLATLFFDSAMITFIVLSEIPWNTMLEPFRRIIASKYIDQTQIS